MAPLKIPMQMSCPNCQAANLPGSPYCSRCGASLEGVMAGAPSAGTVPVSGASAGDPMRRFTAEGQDPALVQQAYARASEILTSGETLEYVAVANKGSLTHAPDCAVATNKRIMLYRKKVLGKLEQDDYYWRDVNHAALKDGRGGVTFTVESIQGWQMAIESLPRAQAVRLYELAVAHSEKLAEALRLKVIQQDAAAPVPAMPPPPTADVYASGPLPTRPSVPALPTIKTPPPPLETPAMQAPEPAQANPTPESVLQAILQQAARNNGAATRPMPMSAAAFQAPVADPQQVTFSETGTDINMRSMPRLNSLEQIAVFTGPLSGRLPTIHDSSGPLTPYEQRSVDPPNGAAKPSRNGGSASRDEAHDRQEAPSPFAPEAEANAYVAHDQGDDYDASYPDGPMPLPGSHSSGPLLEAAYDNGVSLYAGDFISGSLETQQLNAHRLNDLSDRITSTNLAGPHGDHNQTPGRTRRPQSAGRTVPAGTQKLRQPGAASNGRTQARGDADDPVQKMTQLKAMLDAGLIDNDDYEAKKADILSRL